MATSQMVGGANVATNPGLVTTWLWSPPFQAHVDRLYGVPLMTKPAHMTADPYVYQLKGAAQIHYACHGPFAGMILADPVVLDKEIQAVLAIYLAREIPGKTLVVVPDWKVDEWLQKFKDTWEQGYGPKVFHLEDTNTSATDLFASEWDVIICDYEFVAASYKKLQDGGATAPLHTLVNGNVIPWKTVYLDEPQQEIDSNTFRPKHIAIKNLHRGSTVFLTAYLMFDLWADVYGAINLLNNHPWTTKAKFTRTFGDAGTTFNPRRMEKHRMVLLQKFLQGVVIKRPGSQGAQDSLMRALGLS